MKVNTIYPQQLDTVFKRPVSDAKRQNFEVSFGMKFVPNIDIINRGLEEGPRDILPTVIKRHLNEIDNYTFYFDGLRVLPRRGVSVYKKFTGKIAEYPKADLKQIIGLKVSKDGFIDNKKTIREIYA